ncbi:MAG: hypothetical protein ACTHKV_03790 [Flavipsychrobacter sp.]
MKNQFLAELITRLFSKSPKFFRIIQILSGAVVILSTVIDQLRTSGMVLPPWIDFLSATAVKIGGLTAIIMAQLPKVDASQQNPNT